MLNKAQQLNIATKTKLQQDVESFIADVATQLKSPVYTRGINLPLIFAIRHSFEVDEPNLVNPTDDDVTGTVHILARLEAELTYEDVKLRSGMFDRDYGRLMRIYHAISKENENLNRQLSIIHQREQMTVATVEKAQAKTEKVKAA